MEDWKNLADLEMTILWRFRWKSRETNIPADRSILLRVKYAPYFYSIKWEHSQEKLEWFNTMQNAPLGNCFHLGWASEIKWNEEGIRLSQQSDKHMECSRNLKYFTITRSMNAEEEKHDNELEKHSWRLHGRLICCAHHYMLHLAKSQELWKAVSLTTWKGSQLFHFLWFPHYNLKSTSA